MSKQEQILNISPSQELKFLGPFNVMSSAYLKLYNPTNNYVLYKIKTTAPKKYCVRPNAGVVQPHTNVHVQVCLQPFFYDPNEKNKHKFMVQSILWDPKKELSHDETWKEAKPEQLMDTKLRCVFDVSTCAESGPAKKSTAPTSATAPQTDSESSRYVSGDSPSNDGELLVKTRKDLQHLMDEDANLREENIALKEELSLLRSKVDAVQSSAKWSPTQVQPAFQSSAIILAFLFGLVGIILGKFLL